jgi:hypothetical protein
VIATLGPWASLGAFGMLQRRPMGDEPALAIHVLPLGSSRCGAGPLGARCVARVGVTGAKLLLGPQGDLAATRPMRPNAVCGS